MLSACLQSDDLFEEIMTSCWHLGDSDKFSSSQRAKRSILVKHRDGRTSLQMMDDPAGTLDGSDSDLLVSKLRAMGIVDVVSAKLAGQGAGRESQMHLDREARRGVHGEVAFGRGFSRQPSEHEIAAAMEKLRNIIVHAGTRSIHKLIQDMQSHAGRGNQLTVHAFKECLQDAKIDLSPRVVQCLIEHHDQSRSGRFAFRQEECLYAEAP